jgi:large subunit ribosomal protein L3
VPYWLERKERPRDDQYITKENKHFIKEVVEEKFGVPQIIKGIECYPNSSKLLINTNEIVKQEWVPGIRRTGLVGRQIGHYPLWKKDGTRIDTTVIQITDNHVIKYIKPEDYQPTKMPKIKKLNKFGCLLVGSESIDPSLLTKNYMGLFKDSGVMPKKNLSRFIISPEAALPAGTPLNVTHFRVGDFVDVRGYT